ncbi:hypothetical protein [Pontibacter korlensis]|nr:hypothetical protein [Pontibacter korlensis]
MPFITACAVSNYKGIKFINHTKSEEKLPKPIKQDIQTKYL